MEEWCDVVGWESLYQVSNLGRVRSLRTLYAGEPLIVKPYEANLYLYVRFSIYDEVERALVHRVVAEAFIPNPNGLPEVHHKDGNKHNCKLDNLEWVTKIDNHAKRNKYVIEQYALTEEYITEYGSSRAAARAAGYPQRAAAINLASKTWPATSCGYKWKRRELVC